MVLRSLRILRELEKTQRLSRDELESLQSRRLRSVVSHAFQRVPYYRRRFTAAGITPHDIGGSNDLLQIPITTKSDLQNLALPEILASGLKSSDCVVKNTSGSTGKPLRLYFHPSERDYQSLLNLRIFRAAGFRLTDRTGYLINPHRFPKGRYWFQRIGLLRRYYLSVFDLPEAHLQALRQIQPQILYGYPSNLTLLALLMLERDEASLRPKAVFSSAEALEAKPRALIAAAMNTAVYDILGLVETGDIAWECPAHRGYHMNSDAVIMEFLDRRGRPVRPGQPGRLVCTSLYQYAMPLIRYEVGDICLPSDRRCACGRTLPLIESIQGRANDFIVLPDGRIVASCFLVITMQDFDDVAQYRVVQDSPKALTVLLVKGRDFQSSTPLRIAERIRQITGNSLEVETKIVARLGRDTSGKIRTVVSSLLPGFQDRVDAAAGVRIEVPEAL